MIESNRSRNGTGALPYTVGGLSLPGREVVLMVTYAELFALLSVLIGLANLIIQISKKK